MNFPALIKPNDVVRIVAPSGIVEKEKLQKAIKALESWGLIVQLADNLFNNHNMFAAKDELRLSDFQDALDDHSVKVILCARGGYGFTRILDLLNFNAFTTSPKWVIGFSDITAFLQMSYHLGIGSIHGPMGTSFARIGANDSISALQYLLFNGKSRIEAIGKQPNPGFASGELIGGNLALICDSIGTKSELNTDGKILVLEDIGEYYYRVDRMLTQLKRTGKLTNLKGLVIGSFSSITNNGVEFGESVNQMINRLTDEYSYPVAVNMPIGHEPANFPFVYGGEYELVVESDTSYLTLLTRL